VSREIDGRHREWLGSRRERFIAEDEFRLKSKLSEPPIGNTQDRERPDGSDERFWTEMTCLHAKPLLMIDEGDTGSATIISGDQGMRPEIATL